MGSDDTEARRRVAKLERALTTAQKEIAALRAQQNGNELEARRDPSSVRFRALFEHALDAILIADDEGRYLDGNPAAAELLGVSREELIGKTVADFGPPDLEISALWQNFLDSAQEQGVFPIYRPDGGIRYAEYAAVSDFLPGRHLSILRDITERKRVEKERERLVQELEALTRTLEQRVQARTAELELRSEQLRIVASALTVAEQRERERISQILHDDLQQLLHAAQLRVMMLEAEPDAVNNESIHEGVVELQRLTDRALTVARTLTVELRPPVLEGEGLVAAFAWLAGHMESAYGLQVEVSVKDDVEPVSDDLRELAFQMVRELLFNVVKHAEVERARLVLSRQGERCALMVIDEGAGFDPAFLEQKGDNTGYGLWSIRERLRLFEGSLAVEAAPGVGTTVTLTLPCRASGADKPARDGM